MPTYTFSVNVRTKGNATRSPANRTHATIPARFPKLKDNCTASGAFSLRNKKYPTTPAAMMTPICPQAVGISNTPIAAAMAIPIRMASGAKFFCIPSNACATIATATILSP